MKTNNKNKKILFLLRDRITDKNMKDILKTFITASLIVSITAGVMSYADNRITRNIQETNVDKENKLLNLKNSFQNYTLSDIIRKILLINDSSAATTTILSKIYKANDSNLEIKKLQQFLNNNGFTVSLNGAGSKGRETTTLGSATIKALTAFQKKYNLSNTGTITQETIDFINNFGLNKNVTTSTNTDKSSEIASIKEIKLDDVQYISGDKDFQILNKKTGQLLLNVLKDEKLNINFNQSNKTYIVSKNGLIMLTSFDALEINNSNNANISFGNKKESISSKIALKSDFDNKANITSVTNVQAATEVPVVAIDTTPTNSTATAIVPVIANDKYVIQNYTYASIPSEFKIRVGIQYDIFPATFVSTSIFNVVEASGTVVTSVNVGENVIINYNKITKLYSITKNGVFIKETSDYVKLLNVDNTNGIFTIVNMEKRPYWNSAINFNMYRGDLEIRYNSSYDKTWIINELNIEDYLKGMGESSNSSSYEYLKTMAVAERTYAAYHYLSGKNAKSFFHVFCTESDQVYDGYAREIRQPNVVSAVKETKGVVAMYNNDLIQAFYSANAGGKTRTISETWGGADLPYLKVVSDPYTVNDVRFGHGVGISQIGAMRMIFNENATFDKVLRYYYVGIDLKKIY